jgi:hypothetical protein
VAANGTRVPSGTGKVRHLIVAPGAPPIVLLTVGSASGIKREDPPRQPVNGDQVTFGLAL